MEQENPETKEDISPSMVAKAYTEMSLLNVSMNDFDLFGTLMEKNNTEFEDATCRSYSRFNLRSSFSQVKENDVEQSMEVNV